MYARYDSFYIGSSSQIKVQSFDLYYLPLDPAFWDKKDYHMFTIPQAQTQNGLDKASTCIMPYFPQN